MTDQPKQYNTMEEMVKDASKKYSKEEIETYMDLGNKLACWPVLSEVTRIVESRSNMSPSAQQLITDILNTIPSKQCGHISIQMREENGEPLIKDGSDEVLLGMSLSITKVNEYPSINVPDVFVNDVLANMHNLLNTAVAFWSSYSSKHKKLVSKLAKIVPKVDFSKLKQDSVHKNILYFDEQSATRICVFCYYFNSRTKDIYWHRPSTALSVADDNATVEANDNAVTVATNDSAVATTDDSTANDTADSAIAPTDSATAVATTASDSTNDSTVAADDATAVAPATTTDSVN